MDEEFDFSQFDDASNFDWGSLDDGTDWESIYNDLPTDMGLEDFLDWSGTDLGDYTSGIDWGSLGSGALDIIKKLGGNAAGNLGNSQNLLGILGSLYTANQNKQNSKDMAFYGNKLKDLLSNPSSFKMNPAYQTMYDQGLEAVNRTAGAKGLLGSGNRLLELQNTGSKIANLAYNDEANRLAGLAGQFTIPSINAGGAASENYGQILQDIFKNPTTSTGG